jgi:hypothetical protein
VRQAVTDVSSSEAFDGAANGRVAESNEDGVLYARTGESHEGNGERQEDLPKVQDHQA